MEKQKRAILFVRVEERVLAADPFILDYAYKTLTHYCREHQLDIAHAFYTVGPPDYFEKAVLPGIEKGILRGDILLVNYFHELAVGITRALVNEALLSADIQIQTIYPE